MTATTTRAAETWAHILEQPDGMHMGYAADFATDDGSEPAEACAAVEAVAQQHLDAHPDDYRARRLLGEWLQWHGDERGEGYRALGVCRRRPLQWQSSWLCAFEDDGIAKEHRQHSLPLVWFDAFGFPNAWTRFDTRRDAENAAALAFARLPAERRAALLKGEM